MESVSKVFTILVLAGETLPCLCSYLLTGFGCSYQNVQRIATKNNCYYFSSSPSPSGVALYTGIDRYMLHNIATLNTSIHMTAELISSAISLPLVVATFIAALLGTFTSWVMSFFFLERVWDKIFKPDADADVDLTDLMEMSEREGKGTNAHLHF